MIHYYDCDKIDFIGLIEYLKSSKETKKFIENDESISFYYKDRMVTIRNEGGHALLWADKEIFSELEKILKKIIKPKPYNS
ncbi:MAG: hypothetical protein Q8P79_00800 [Nanoarchaeota archaeon]|nr:hypothetical protein [Nanoarchaeota archaeon]